jgi:soluble lytic murein transglycosylase-like protein
MMCRISLVVCCWLLIGAVSVSAQSKRAARSTPSLSNQYETEFADAARRHGVDAKLLRVIGYLESRFNPLAVSPKGARGLMQFIPATARRFGLNNPHEPAQAIEAAARYVRTLQTQFGARPDLILAAYNAGETTVTAYLTGQTIRVGEKVINAAGQKTNGIPPYRETQRYVAQGLRLLRVEPFWQAPRVRPLLAVKRTTSSPAKSISFQSSSAPQTSAQNSKPRLSISFQ